MSMRLALWLLIAGLGACASPGVEPVPTEVARGDRALDILPAGADLARVRRDLLATAQARLGAAGLAELRSAPTYLIAKRFVGMAPPPPPGAPPDWTPTPNAQILIHRSGHWLVADSGRWRPANLAAAAEIDQIIGSSGFWADPPYTPPCPDFGASLLLLKAEGHSETVRNSGCSSRASQIVEAALRA